jgi:hypothetical protein
MKGVTVRQLTLKTLEVQHILDIEGIRFDFHPRITVLTGRNSQGKTLLCGAAMLALLGLKELGSTHWKDKITSKNLARRGWQKGSATLHLLLGRDPYTFTYRHRTQSPHEAQGPDGKVDGKDTLLQFGIDLGALGFLTTRERRPAWQIVDGESKNGDTNTILKNSLSARLSARVKGCEGVRKVLENEIKTVQQQLRNVDTDIAEIVNRWREKKVLDPAEPLANVSANLIEERLANLTDLKCMLEGVDDADSRVDSLTQLQRDLSEVQDLGQLIERRAAADAALEEVQRRETAVERLDAGVLNAALPALPAASDHVQGVLADCHARARQLSECLAELAGLQAKPSSLGALTDQKSGYEDQKKKLERAKTLRDKRGDGVPVLCTIYRGDTLFVEIDKMFADTVSFDELTKAEVVVPYSKAEEEQVGRIADALRTTETAAKEMESAAETAQEALNKDIADLRVSITERQTKLKGLLPKLRDARCPEANTPDVETGARLASITEWVRREIAAAEEQQQNRTSEIDQLVGATGMRGWKAKLDPSSGEPLQVVLDQLKEAIQSLIEHKQRFVKVLEEADKHKRTSASYDKAVEILDVYLDKVRFKDEVLDQLVQAFLDFVRRGKERFEFSFDIDEHSDGELTIRSQYHEGTIQTGGGETQVLGILEMLAIAQEFGLPVFLDEVGSYLDRDNLRKVLEFVIEHTEVQAVLTTADDGFLQQLEEWGIPHRGYVVVKTAQGFTQLRSHRSRAPSMS